MSDQNLRFGQWFSNFFLLLNREDVMSGLVFLGDPLVQLGLDPFWRDGIVSLELLCHHEVAVPLEHHPIPTI